MTATTIIPVNANGTHDDATWGESGGPYSVPGMEQVGLMPGTPLAADTLNYEWQHLARWVRALRDRLPRTDAGILASCILPGSGAWNIAGGTLDGTLGPSWICVDANDDGGVIVQFNLPLGAPHTFNASRDTYVNLNEAGAVEYQAVALGDVPSPTAGYVPIWKIVTDGTEITEVVALVHEATLFAKLAAQSLKSLGTLSAEGQITGQAGADITGDVTVGSNASVTGNVTAGGNIAAGGTLSCNGDFTATGNSQIGNASTDTCTIPSVTTVSAPLTNYTHAVTSGWEDDYRPSTRTFTASGITAEQFGDEVDITITSAAASSEEFTRGVGSAIMMYRVDLVLVIGAQSDATPEVSTLAHRYAASFDMIATLNDGDITDVTTSTVLETSAGLAVDVSCEGIVTSSNVEIRVNIGESNANFAPYRIGATVAARRVSVDGPL